MLCLWAACAPDFLLCGSRSTRRPYSPAPVPRPTPVSPTRKCLVLRGLCVFLARFQAKRKSKRRSFRCCSLFPRACFRFFSEPDTRSELRPRPHYTPHYHTLTIITTPLHRHIQQHNFLHERHRNTSSTPFDRARRALSIGRKGLSVRASCVVHFLFLRL